MSYSHNLGWFVVFYVPSTARSFRGHSLSFAKYVRLCFFTVSTGNRTPGRRVAVHYTTAAPRQLHTQFWKKKGKQEVIDLYKCFLY